MAPRSTATGSPRCGGTLAHTVAKTFMSTHASKASRVHVNESSSATGAIALLMQSTGVRRYEALSGKRDTVSDDTTPEVER